MALCYRDKSLDVSNSSDSDSENDCDVWKRGVKSLSEPTVAFDITENNDITTNMCKKRKPNNIWTEVVMENDMTETIDSVGIQEIPKNSQDRSCESYDFTRRQLDTRPYIEDVLGMDSENISSIDKNSVPGTGRKFTKLSTDDARVAKRICWKLSEPKKYLIYRVVDTVGTAKALQILKETEEVEENGGMLVKNSSRRRTPGGVYLTILKTHITDEQKEKIFEGEVPPSVLYKEKRALMKAFDIKFKKNKNKKKKKLNKRPKPKTEDMDMDASSVKPIKSEEKRVSFADEVHVSASPTESEQAYCLSGNSESSGLENSSINEVLKSESLSEDSDVEDGEILD